MVVNEVKKKTYHALPYFAILVMFALFLGGKSWTRQSSVGAGLSGRLAVDRPTVDLGRLPPNTQRNVKFLLSNTSKEVIDIVNVELSCSCLTPRLNSRSLSPGESTTLEVRWITGSKHGIAKGKINLSWKFASSSSPRSQRLEITGDVSGDFECLPSRVEFSTRHTVPVTVRLEPRERSDVEILEVSQEGEWYHAERGTDRCSVVIALKDANRKPNVRDRDAVKLRTSSVIEPIVIVPVVWQDSLVMTESEIREWHRRFNH